MRISDWSSDVCSSDLLKVLEQRREFFWIVRSAFEKVPASLVRLSHPPNDSVSINDSTSLDLRIEKSEEHTSELQSLMRISYAVFCLKKKKIANLHYPTSITKTHCSKQTTENTAHQQL